MAGYEQLADTQFLRDILFGIKRDEPESATPLFMIGLGGTGAEVLRRVKWRVKWLGLDDLVRFLVIDADSSPKNARDNYPGFEDHEFVLLEHGAARIVMKNQDQHEALADRLDLNHEDNAVRKCVQSEFENSLRQHIEGSGQIRRVGTLRFAANHHAVKDSISRALRHLNQRWRRLDSRRRQQTRLERFNTIIVSSICGGTGAGILADVACIVNQMIRDSQVFSFLTLPDVYDPKIEGKGKQTEQIRAMAYACLQELEWIRSGDAHHQHARLSSQYKPPVSDPFRNVNLISRIDATGKDLFTTEAVFDSIALYLSAFASEQIGGATLSEICNERLDRELRTGRTRWWGTVGATALSIPVIELLRYCSFSAAHDCVIRFILGPDNANMGRIADEWLAAADLEERNALSQDRIIDRLREAVDFRANRITDDLYESVRGGKARYLNDREFVRKVPAIKQNWDQNHGPSLEEDIRRLAQTLVERSTKSLDERVTQLIGGASEAKDLGGLRPAAMFLRTLSGVLADTADELRADADQSNQNAKAAFADAARGFKRINTWFGRIGTDEKRQDEIVMNLRAAIEADGTRRLQEAARFTLVKLDSEVRKRITRLQKAIDAWEGEANELENLAAAHQFIERGIPYGASQSELSVITPDIARTILQRHALSAGDFAARIAELSESQGKDKYAEWVVTMTVRERMRLALGLAVALHYAENLASLNVLELLEAEEKATADGGDRPLHTRLDAVFESCIPLWPIRYLNEKDEVFQDGIAIGRPPANKAYANRFERLVNDAAPSMKVGQFLGVPGIVVTNDSQRIYAVRRVSGGIPHFLPDWQEWRDIYVKYQKRHGDAHTVSRDVVADLPPMEPFAAASRGDREFAIAIAFGWIARRGNFYYFNIEKTAAETYDVMLVSTYDCLAFESGAVRQDLGSLGALKDGKMLAFKNAKSAPPSRKLGSKGGRANALREFKKAEGAVDLVNEVYETLISKAGEKSVRSDLESYKMWLEKSGNPRLVADEIAMIEQEIESIKRR